MEFSIRNGSFRLRLSAVISDTDVILSLYLTCSCIFGFRSCLIWFIKFLILFYRWYGIVLIFLTSCLFFFFFNSSKVSATSWVSLSSFVVDEACHWKWKVSATVEITALRSYRHFTWNLTHFRSMSHLCKNQVVGFY